MKLPKELTTVTKLSKILATILFVSLPFVGFLIGTKYQQTISSQSELAKLEMTSYPTPTPSSGCYYADNPEAACPKKDCGKILICPSPAANETANWKTYTNKTHNYILKIPSDWTTQEYPNSADGSVNFVPSSEREKDRSEVILMTVVIKSKLIRYNLNTQKQFNEWLQKDSSQRINERQFKIKNTIIDGINAVQFVTRTLPGDEIETFYSIVTWVHKDGINYYIEIGGNEKNVNDLLKTYNQILSTFQFLK